MILLHEILLQQFQAECFTKLKNIQHQAQKPMHQTFRILHQIMKNSHET